MSKLRAVLFVLVSLLVASALHAQVVYVKANAAGANNGTSWFDAYTDLQSAMGAPNGTQVWIAAGTYKPGNTRDATFSPNNNISLYGGFAGGETQISQRDLFSNQTILSGEIGGSGVGDNCYHVVTVDSGIVATFDGLVITRGNSTSTPYGGGMLVYGIVNVANCRIVDNYASQGGGIAVIGSSGSTIVNSVFFGNQSVANGAALWFLGGGYVEGCTFSGNTAGSYAVIYEALATGSPQIRNTIVWGNPASEPVYPGYADVASSIIEGQTASDPLFVDAGAGNLRLRPGSPAIDAGYNGFIPGGVILDADGAARVSGNAVDIGAYESAPDRLTVTRFGTGSGTVTSAPALINCGATCVASALVPGAQYQLTATPVLGYYFTGWGGACSGVGTCIVHVPASVTAHFSRVWFVNASATSGGNDGGSWIDAFTNLQSAFTVAVPGDEIWVAAGTYKPTATTDRAATFSLKSGVAIYGGFAGTETSRAQRVPATNITTLSGDIGTPGDNSDNSFTVVTASRVDSGAVLDGFTISGGNGGSGSSPSPGNIGGGLRLFIAYPQISNCTLTQNVAQYGGGIGAYGGGGTVSDSVIGGNLGTDFGGGVFTVRVSSFSMLRSTLVNNSGYGSAVYAWGGRPLFDSCRMLDNHGPGSSGPTVFLFFLSNDPNAPVFRNCEVVGTDQNNTVFAQSSGTFLNCTIVGPNTASRAGSAMRVEGPFGYSPSVNVINTIMWGNDDPNLNYFSDSGGTFANNIYNVDPQFVIEAVTGKHRIGASSPAIDAGDNPSAAALQTDLEGMLRRRDDPNTADTGNGTAPIVDIGAYEFYPVNVSVPSDVGACPGAQVTLQATATGFGALTYQWRRGNPVRVNIPGATSSSYVINSYSSAANADTYDVVVTDSHGTTTTSSPIVLHDGATSISSFTPSSGGLGTLVTISGSGFNAVTDVRINGTSSVIKSVTDTQLIIAVSGSNTTGLITVMTAGGCSATSATSFTVAPFAPPSNFVATATSPSAVALTWNPVGGASTYVIQRSSLIGTVQSLTTTPDAGFVDTTAQPNTAYVYRVEALQSGTGAPAPSNKDLATTVIFADDPIPPSSQIKADQWTELRTAVNAVHVLAGYGNASFSNAIVVGNVIHAPDLQELRDSLLVSLSALTLPTTPYTDDPVQGGVTKIKKQHVEEIRNLMR